MSKAGDDIGDFTLYEAALALQNGLVAHATDGGISEPDYKELRTRLMADPRSRRLMPSYVRVPEGAITAARTLLETVCKLILDDVGLAYSDDDLPKLYGKVARALNLAPSDHTEDAFKQILGGCWSVVNGLGTLRNRISDAHGQGARPVRPAPRHADLAVNLAGAMAAFLVETWRARSTAHA